MDQEVEELKRLVQKNIAIAEDTNRIIYGMRRTARWGRFFQLVWWVAIFAVSGAAYYYYLQPYVNTIEKAYGSTRNFESQVQDFFKNFGTKQTTSSSTTAH